MAREYVRAIERQLQPLAIEVKIRFCIASPFNSMVDLARAF